ncbi:RNA polymerase sigma factor RpoS [Roseivivax sp. THAF40]|nr:RNA polymerase sigma factor RpoS [Roseivivax sp. THAF40]
MVGSYRKALQEAFLGLEEERSAIIKWQIDRDAASIDLIVRSHARQVWSYARKCADNPSQLEDLVAEGVVGLIRAADKFDTNRGVRFSTYAAWWVRNEISTALKRERAMAATGWAISENGVQGEVVSHSVSTFSIQDAVELDDLPSEEASPEEDALRRSEEASIAKELASAMDGLTSIESEIIRRRRLSADPEPFDVIAYDLKATPAKIRQLETRAMARLRQGLLAQGFSLSVFQ